MSIVVLYYIPMLHCARTSPTVIIRTCETKLAILSSQPVIPSSVRYCPRSKVALYMNITTDLLNLIVCETRVLFECSGLSCTLLYHSMSDLEGPQKGKMLYDAEVNYDVFQVHDRDVI